VRRRPVVLFFLLLFVLCDVLVVFRAVSPA